MITTETFTYHRIIQTARLLESIVTRHSIKTELMVELYNTKLLTLKYRANYCTTANLNYRNEYWILSYSTEVDAEYWYCQPLFDWIALHYYKGVSYKFLVLFTEPIHCFENSNSVCLIHDAVETWLLLKLSPKIWTILSSQIVTRPAKWLAGFKGGFKFTKFIA